MFSDKEFLLVFGGGMGLSFFYLILRLSAGVDNKAEMVVSGTMIFMQIIPFLLYMALLVIHIKMLYYAKRFMDKSVEGEFKKSFKLLNYSEMITVLSVFWILLISADFPNFYESWAQNPVSALKISFFPYWFFETFMHGRTGNWQFTILWHLPLTVFSALFEVFTYKKYYKAKHRYTHMYPSVSAPDFFNAFISKRKKGRSTSLIIPTDSLEEIEVPPCETVPRKDNGKTDPYSPLGKNLGNNSLYVVDSELLGKRKNTFKTQAEIDAEEGGFFSGEDADDTMISFLPKRKKNIDKKSEEYAKLQSQNLSNSEKIQPQPVQAENKADDPTEKPYDEEIPLDIDYQSFYRTNKEKEILEQQKQNAQNPNIMAAEAGMLSGSDAQAKHEKALDDEIPLDIDYQSFYKVKDTEEKKAEKEKSKNLVPCPFCGTLNLEDRDECIFCGAELNRGDY